MPSSADSQCPRSKVCPAVLAGKRITRALKSWERELKLEIESNLEKIVKPLTTAYVDTKHRLNKADLQSTLACRLEIEQLVAVLEGVNNGVSAPWHEKQPEASNLHTKLSMDWKKTNPLSHMQKDIATLEAALKAMADKSGPHTCDSCHGCALLNSVPH